MNKRNYNVFFNTHTISGIVISVALYIIFFAGAFAMFKDEISIWEEGKFISNTAKKDIDYDYIFRKLEERHELTGRDIQFKIRGESDKISIFLGASKDSLASEKGKKSHFFYVDTNSVFTTTYQEQYGLGEFLYRLHFFAQLPRIGFYLAGFVAFFFLFAMVTGVIVHWKKIIPNFYTFNPKVILKRVWTDAHTALGVIGLPFQFIFAVTGTYFALSVLVLIPANTLYNNDQEKLTEDIRPARKNYDWIEATNSKLYSFNEFAKKTSNNWNNFHLTRGFIKNYGGTNMKYVLIGELISKDKFIGLGRMVYDSKTNTIIEEKNPHELSYIEDAQHLVNRLHFGDFVGTPIKIIYFILAFITCFVIITGVLIWIEARNKKSMCIKQRLYTAKVGHIYLAICLPMLPITALAFLFVKFSNGYFYDKQTTIYWFYFISWLAAILFFRFKRDNYFTNKYSLLSGAILGFLIPIANGIVSNNWIWNTYKQHQFNILLVDVLWGVIATFSLLFYFKIAPKNNMQSTFNKNPIDYKNIIKLIGEESKDKPKISLSEPKKRHNNNKGLFMKTKIISLWILIPFWLCISPYLWVSQYLF